MILGTPERSTTHHSRRLLIPPAKAGGTYFIAKVDRSLHQVWYSTYPTAIPFVATLPNIPSSKARRFSIWRS